MQPFSSSELDELRRLLTGQLSVADTDRLAAAYADDERVPTIAEAVALDDPLLATLRQHQASTVEHAQVDQLVSALVTQLRHTILANGSTLKQRIRLTNEPPPEQIDAYRIVRVLGQGGMGTVYCAEDTRSGRQVALKTLNRMWADDAGARERFLREARSVAQLDHAHVVPIYHVGEADGVPFLTMPLLRGEPLDRLLDRQRQRKMLLPLTEVVRIAEQVAEGLVAAHAYGLIHRDIKPANIWLEAPTGCVRLLDFGLAWRQGDAHLTASGMVVGTPAYMAPEQARGLPVDPRTDLFSLGCVLYELITGRRPFAGADVMALLTSLAIDTPPAPHTLNPRCPRRLSDLTMSLLAKQISQRPLSAEAVRGELVQYATPVPRRWPIMAATVWAALVMLAVVRFKGEPPVEPIVVTEQPPAPPVVVPTVPPNRAAAEYVLSLGGRVWVHQPPVEIFKLADLPVDDFVLSKVEIVDAPKLSDAGLAVFQGCTRLQYVELSGTTFSDAGLAHFAGCTELEVIRMCPAPRVSDVGMSYFKNCSQLRWLHLRGTPITDMGLGYLQPQPELEELSLTGPGITDVSMGYLARCPRLRILALGHTKVTTAGFALGAAFTNLNRLELAGRNITTDTLRPFAKCAALTDLWLDETLIDDAGLALFHAHRRIKDLRVNDGRVTEAGILAFRTAHPACTIHWDEIRLPAQK